jgi:uncharacterized protein YecT (DUF1311 family)
MKQYVISLALLIAALVAFPPSHANAQSQPEMNGQAAKDFEKADTELNKTYEALLRKLPDAEGKEKLKQSQRAWLTFRDAEAAFASDQARGGSMAPTIRYETITELTQQRIKQLKARHPDDAAPDEKDASTPSPTPTATSSASAQESDKGPAAQNPSSVSPDKQWEYKGGEIVKAGTTQVVLDLDQELEVYGPETEIVWAPDSKRFGFNYSPLHAHHYVWITVAFYELRGEQWVALPSLLKESERSQVVQLAKEQLPKKLRCRREAARTDILKIRRWIDRDTAILYAYSVWDDAAKVAFLFTVKFDAGGKPKIVKTERLPEKEAEEEQ